MSIVAVYLLSNNSDHTIVMKTVSRRLLNANGFSLTDMVATAAVVATLSAIAIPQSANVLDSWRLGMALRDVERELQSARLEAVSTNRPLRVRFDCPLEGQFRVVELIGSPAVPDANDGDLVTNRCSESLYPYPTANRNRLRRPNNDGPIRRLAAGTTVAAQKTLEFWPDGSVHADAAAGDPWPNVGSPGVMITLIRKGKSKSITVNGLGKIFMDR
jgi:Tfp pilus assembly protein FimT